MNAARCDYCGRTDRQHYGRTTARVRRRRTGRTRLGTVRYVWACTNGPCPNRVLADRQGHLVAWQSARD